MTWWDEKAARLQDSVKAGEAKSAPLSHYNEDDVAQATVHGRQDIVLLVAQLSALNGQVRTIKWLLVFIALAVGIVAPSLVR